MVRQRPGQPHQLESLTYGRIFEVSTHHEDSDSYRVLTEIVKDEKALITGINGQDGGYLEFLLEKGYQVFGMERRSSTK